MTDRELESHNWTFLRHERFQCFQWCKQRIQPSKAGSARNDENSRVCAGKAAFKQRLPL